MTVRGLRSVFVLNRFRFGKTSVVAQAWLAGIYPSPRKYPRKYPRGWLAKSLVKSRTCEKYPQYPQYPRDVGDFFFGALEYPYLHKETLNFTLLIYMYKQAKSPESPKGVGILGILGIFSGNQAIMRVCEFLALGIFWGCPRGTGMTAVDESFSCLRP